MNKYFVYLSIAASSLFVSSFILSPAFSAPPGVTVNSTLDVVANDGFCTLREAVINANDGAQTHTDCDKPKGKTAKIDITAPGGPVILLIDNLLITSPMIITGPGPEFLTIDGDENDRHFEVRSTNLELSGVRLTKGSASGDDGGSILADDFGGGPSSLTITNVLFDNNVSTDQGGGAIGLDGGSNLSVSNSAFIGNIASGAAGGAIYWTSGGGGTVMNSVFIDNSTTVSFGGAIANLNGDVVVMGSYFSGNNSNTDGGAISNISVGGNNASLSVSSSIISGNTAVVDGGGIATEAQDGVNGDTANTTIIDSVMINNSASGNGDDLIIKGSGVHTLTFTNNIIDDCFGGGCP